MKNQTNTQANIMQNSSDIRWSWKKFQILSLDELYELLLLRQQVFVVEQQCPYLDLDRLDQYSWHLLGHDSTAQLICYLRVLFPGQKYSEPAIGRVVVHPDYRGQQLGQQLMAEGVKRCTSAYPSMAIRLAAQRHLTGFYQSFGFKAIGEPYQEDGIPHIDMLREAQ